ncbi:bacteriohemerythrin [Ancylomarina sp.]|uniref:bacteriohemerythrin n=1 Tax=Ancylomarina sp. TaxID=1970196 RepID=UPI00356418AD
MEIIQWSEKISVNNTIIDRQHKKLIELINELSKHSNERANSKVINETLSELLKYTLLHFNDEEEFMKRANYPKLNEHKKKHKEFSLKIALFCTDVQKNKATVTQELLQFLVDWLVQHTSVDDQDYKNHI